MGHTNCGDYYFAREICKYMQVYTVSPQKDTTQPPTIILTVVAQF